MILCLNRANVSVYREVARTFLSVSVSLKPTTFSASVASWYGLVRSCFTASEASFRSMFLFSRAKVLLTEYVLGGKLPSLWMRLLVYFTWMIAYSFRIKSALSVKYSTYVQHFQLPFQLCPVHINASCACSSYIFLCLFTDCRINVHQLPALRIW